MHVLLTMRAAALALFLLLGLLAPREASAQFNGCSAGFCPAFAGASVPAPTVSSVSPNTGPVVGGTSVAVGGTNYGAGGASVSALAFGANPAASFSCSSPTACTATSPAGTGTVDVKVTTPAGTSATSGADQFTYIAATTWDPSSIGSNITLSGGNLVATHSTTGGYNGFRSVASHSTGKFYNEVTIGNSGAFGGDAYQAGIVNSSASLNTYLGVDNNGAGSFGATAEVFLNNASVGAIGAYAANGTVLSVAIDIGALKYWISVGGGNWNNSGSANPDTGVGGLSLSTLTGAPFYFAGDLNGQVSTISLTANFGATAYANKATAGACAPCATSFGNW